MSELKKPKVKKQYLKKAKIFGLPFLKKLKAQLATKKADPKGKDGGDLEVDAKQEGGLPPQPLPPPPDAAEALHGVKVRIWSDAYGKKSWGATGTVTELFGEDMVLVQTENMAKHKVKASHVQRLDSLKEKRQAKTLRIEWAQTPIIHGPPDGGWKSPKIVILVEK